MNGLYRLDRLGSLLSWLRDGAIAGTLSTAFLALSLWAWVGPFRVDVVYPARLFDLAVGFGIPLIGGGLVVGGASWLWLKLLWPRSPSFALVGGFVALGTCGLCLWLPYELQMSSLHCCNTERSRLAEVVVAFGLSVLALGPPWLAVVWARLCYRATVPIVLVGVPWFAWVLLTALMWSVLLYE